MLKLFVLSLLLLASCGGEPPVEDTELQCFPSDRSGTYLVEYTWLDGDCGELSDELVILPITPEQAAELPCILDRESWSDNNCRYDLAYSCYDGSSVTATTTQRDETGKIISGEFSLQGGDPIYCRGFYEIKYTRQ